MAQPQQQTSVLSLAKKVTELAEKQTSDGSVSQKDFVDAIQRLQIAVEGPAHYVARMRHQPAEYISVLLAVESGVLKALVESGDTPLSAQQLAEGAKADPLLITRFMRLLCAAGVFDEAGPSKYKCNAISRWLNKPGQADGFRLVAEWVLPIGSKTLSLWRANKFTQFPDAKKGEKRPFEWAHSKTQWESLRENPEQKSAFDGYMAARRTELRPAWHEIYPAGKELNVAGYEGPQEPPLLCDVGGNTGYDVTSFKSSNPHIKGRLVVEDLPETLASQAPIPGVETIKYDFFTPQPVKGARAYFFKAVFHDFDDNDCRKFLGNTVAAMDPESCVLIDDWVLPDEGAPQAGASEDMFMMMLLSGMERSESQWKALLNSAGLDIKRIWRSHSGVSECVIEAKLKRN